IKVVVELVKENLVVVWAIGLYPVGTEDCEIELTQFVPVDLEERDHDTQATFQKDEYFSVNDKIVLDTYKNNLRPRILDKVPASNRCLLKVLLVRIVQETSDFKDKENSVIKVSVTDYSYQEYNFIVNIVFQYLDSHFKGLASFIHLKETLVFVVEYDIKNEVIPSSTNSAQSKLLSIHKDISKHAKKKPNNFLEEQLTDEKTNIIDDSINESLEKLEINIEQIEIEQDNKVVSKKIHNKK
ncbi:15722_t:CDS:2, partial [Cetraspora pellucida]